MNMTFKLIDPLPKASGQRADAERRRQARERADIAWQAYLDSRALNHDAKMAVEAANRERRLRPETGTTLHLVRGRMVEVPTRREFPYGPERAGSVEEIVTAPLVKVAKTTLVKMKAAFTALASAFAVGGKEK